MSSDIVPAYGASEHYLGHRGDAYFAWQSAGGMFAAQINVRKFASQIAPTDIVIDFGCGGGFLLKSLNCARRIGVEINPVARRHAVDLGVECVATVDEVADEIADVVVSDHALEHVPFPIGALDALRRKLKPDGTLVLCVPIDNWRHQKRYDPTDINHHLQTWTPQTLGNSLVDSGFQPVSIRPRIYAWPGRWTVACYGRLPYWLFRCVCFTYGALTGKGWEIIAIARRGKVNHATSIEDVAD